MKAAVYVHRLRDSEVSPHMMSIANGLRHSGLTVSEFHRTPDPSADFCVTWGLRKANLCKASGFKGPMLIAERGYLNRFEFTSLGWDGINGRARFGGVHDPKRFNRLFARDMKPWKERGGYALLLGQVLGDASLNGVDIIQWYKDTAESLWKEGWDVLFRPHPVSDEKGHERPRVPFARVSQGSLEEALRGAGIAVAWNSNALVDAVMAGVPIHAGDCGSMVYDLASKDFTPIQPSREKRLNEIANVQWTMTELADGTAWNSIREAM